MGFSMRSRILIFYIILVHIFLALVLYKSNFVSRVERKFGFGGSRVSEEQKVNENNKRQVHTHERMDRNMPDGAVVFIGDSLVKGLRTDAVFSPSMNYGIAGDTSVGVLSRLPNYRSLPKAPVVVLAVGINDIGTRDNTGILEKWARILKQVPHGPGIVWSAVLPVDENTWGNPAITNERIRSLNSRMEILCANDARCVFVNAGTRLSDEKGNLSKEFYNDDGLHLNITAKAIRFGLRS